MHTLHLRNVIDQLYFIKAGGGEDSKSGTCCPAVLVSGMPLCPLSMRTTFMRKSLYKVLLTTIRIRSFVSLYKLGLLSIGFLWQAGLTYCLKMASNFSGIFLDIIFQMAKALRSNLKCFPHGNPGSKLPPDNATALGPAWLFGLRCPNFLTDYGVVLGPEISEQWWPDALSFHSFYLPLFNHILYKNCLSSYL